MPPENPGAFSFLASRFADETEMCLKIIKFRHKLDCMNNKKVRQTKTVRLGKRSQMVLPKEVRDWLGVREGQSVVFEIGEEGVRLISAEQFAQSTLGAFAGAWGEKSGSSGAHLGKERSAWDENL
jgi:AbrB family looped-hinge helix DNA binding protein